MEALITEKNASFQYTPPEIHQNNITKRAIQMWKNHFIAIQASAVTLNMVRSYTQNLNLSGHEALQGMFSFDATPMAHISTDCMIHIKPDHHHTGG